jgi:hypothetical protein
MATKNLDTEWYNTYGFNQNPGYTDVTSFLQGLLNGGHFVQCPSDIWVRHRITVPSGGGVEMLNSSKIWVDKNDFNKNDPHDLTSLTSCVFLLAEAGYNQKMYNCWFQGYGYGSNGGGPLSCINSTRGVNTEVWNIRVSDFNLVKGFVGNSLSGNWYAKVGIIEDCENPIDFAPWGYTKGDHQTTLIDIDDNRWVNNGVPVNTQGGQITNMSGYRCGNIGSAAYHGRQSDVVSSGKANGTYIKDIYGEDIDEVVDVYGTNCTGGSFSGLRVSGVLLKLIHGAKNNSFSIVRGTNCGLWGVSFTGGYDDYTEGNTVHDVIIDKVNWNNTFGGNCSGIVFHGDKDGAGNYTPYAARNNTVTSAAITPGVHGRWGVMAEDEFYGGGNTVQSKGSNQIKTGGKPGNAILYAPSGAATISNN